MTLSRYLQIDTSNPPGNESRAVEFLAEILEEAGVGYEVVEPVEGRGSLWARLEGGPEPALILLHHTDVVPAEADAWRLPPFSGAVANGYVHGRGALDTKGLGILHLEAFLALARSGVPLRRPVIFMATADEEAGGAHGAGWIVENRPELFEDAGFLLTEGGGGGLYGGKPVFSIEVAQKAPLWLRLTARGLPGHASAPRPGSAVGSLLRGLSRLEDHRFAPRLTPQVAEYLGSLAELGGGLSDVWSDFDRRGVRAGRSLRLLQRWSPALHALLRNTCSVTRLNAGQTINVVPSTAFAEVDCRLVPGEDVARFLSEVRRVLDEPTIKIETRLSFESPASPTSTELFRALESVLRERAPQAKTLASVVSGFTDSHYFRSLGIVSYGFRPSLPEAEAFGVHGHDERVRLDDFYEGLRMMKDIVDEFVVAEQGSFETGSF
ncbi:MAG: M20/M25/M40 family metallo-hydrolase [Acidobacteriota bacterium]